MGTIMLTLIVEPPIKHSAPTGNAHIQKFQPSHTATKTPAGKKSELPRDRSKSAHAIHAPEFRYVSRLVSASDRETATEQQPAPLVTDQQTTASSGRCR